MVFWTFSFSNGIKMSRTSHMKGKNVHCKTFKKPLSYQLPWKKTSIEYMKMGTDTNMETSWVSQQHYADSKIFNEKGKFGKWRCNYWRESKKLQTWKWMDRAARKKTKKESKPIELLQGILQHSFSETTKGPLKVEC